MKNIALAAVMGTLALAQPALAQDEQHGSDLSVDDIQAEVEQAPSGEAGEDPGTAMAEMMGAIFSAEPLTEEQEARLPAAGAVAAALVPEGVYTRMMRDMMDGTLGGLFDITVDESDAMSSLDLADYTGLYGEEIEDLTEEQRRELTGIFDPVYQERVASEMAEVNALLERVFDRLEPGLRVGLSRALATRFSDGELEAIDAFFSTPAGAKYAGESLIMFSDPQVMASVGQAMPTLMEEMSGLFDGQSDVADGLPEPRRYGDLTPSEQRRASDILGIDQDMLRESMTSAEPAQETPAADGEGSIEDDTEAPAEQGESFEEAMEEIGAE